MSRFESILNKIQNKFKDHCEFGSSCLYFDTEQFTCTNKGSSYCGKYRLFKVRNTMSEQAKPLDIV